MKKQKAPSQVWWVYAPCSLTRRTKHSNLTEVAFPSVFQNNCSEMFQKNVGEIYPQKSENFTKQMFRNFATFFSTADYRIPEGVT